MSYKWLLGGITQTLQEFQKEADRDWQHERTRLLENLQRRGLEECDLNVMRKQLRLPECGIVKPEEMIPTVYGEPKMPKVKFKKLHEAAQLPKRAKEGDAGMDMVAVDDGTNSQDGDQITYSLGLAMELPPGHVGLLFPRSSVIKTGLTLANCVGVIDEGYRGEMKAVFNIRQFDEPLFNTNILRPNLYKKGDRVCQLVVLELPRITTEWANELSDSDRGEGGWGSSGK